MSIFLKVASQAGPELFILPLIALTLAAQLWGSRRNQEIIRKWLEVYGPVLQEEYAVVGYESLRNRSLLEEDDESTGGKRSDVIADVLKQKTAREYITYATGRQNVAYTDLKISLYKRYDPLSWLANYVVGMIFDSSSIPVERVEATSVPFDGKEAEMVPVGGGKQGQAILEQPRKSASSASSYDGFVWAVVHKDLMQHLREQRYDLSLTSTKDNPKLPGWATVMSESAEVTDLLLNSELIEAIKEAGSLFEYLIVTDQPIDQPKKLADTTPQKRLYLSVRLPSSSSSSGSTTTTNPWTHIRLFTHFLRLPDQLVEKAHFRPEVLRKARQTREERIAKLKRVEEDEKAEERAAKRDKEKKEKRDMTLRNLNADEQRKFLEREREKELRKGQKRMTQRA